MVKYSATLKYKVNKDNRVKFIEEKQINNQTDKSYRIENYYDHLPVGVNLNTLKCYQIKDENKTSVNYELKPLEGTNRQKFTIPKPAILL